MTTEIIKKYSEAFGPTGLEDEITSLIFEDIKDFADSCGYSPLGGVYAYIKGTDPENNPTRLICSGVDEVSFMVGDIDDNGFVRPKKLTKYNAGAICSKKVTVGNENIKINGVMSAKVLHLASGSDRENPNIDKCFIDLGYSKKDELEGKIEKGDFITFNESCTSFGKNKLTGKALGNRTNAALMVEQIQSIKQKPLCDTVFFFAVKEKVGMSDLFWAVRKFAPKKTLVLSSLPAINSEKESNCKLDCGVVLPTHDGFSLYFGSDSYTAIINSDIKHQIPKAVEEGQPSAKAQLSGVGTEMINLSLPCRNMLTSGEIISLSDVEEMKKAITYFVEGKI